MNVLIIDNYDSFTFNLYQYVGEILQTELSQEHSNSKVTVKRNNEISLEQIKQQDYDRIIISPAQALLMIPLISGYVQRLSKS